MTPLTVTRRQGHPASCIDPSCSLSYRDHLLTVGFSATCMPTRRVNRTPGLPDEPVTQAITREKRWDRDMDAFSRLTKEGYDVPQIDGARLRERQGETEHDITTRKVTVDYNDPR